MNDEVVGSPIRQADPDVAERVTRLMLMRWAESDDPCVMFHAQALLAATYRLVSPMALERLPVNQQQIVRAIQER